MMKQMNVTSTPFVPTLKGRMYVAVLVDIRVMEEAAQVNISSSCSFGACRLIRFNFLANLIRFLK